MTKSSILKHCALGLVALALAESPTAPAQAQLLDHLKGAVGSGENTGALGSLGGSSMPSVRQASPSNTAGVLQYCVRNNYVNQGAGSSVKNSLMSKVTGTGQTSNDSAFKAGNDGTLQTGNGQNFSLGGSGIKAQLTQKVCDQILQHAKSLL